MKDSTTQSLFSFLYEYGQHDNFVLDLKKDAERYPLIINHYIKWLIRYSTLLHDERYQNHIVYDFENDSLALEKSIIDYLSGMTDHFIIDAFDELLAYRQGEFLCQLIYQMIYQHIKF